MAHRFVRATPIRDRLPELRTRLDAGDVEAMRPFGPALTAALDDARYDPATDEAVWVEEDYCSPPLAQERTVLDDYFTDLRIVESDVDPETGWDRIADLPGLWAALAADA
ncbi:hypothetical protein ACFR97_09615 [Haloplanus litoreus]|uniref:Uncharacterized protein n=1 Tax=Haloplanus litoreus TaxID=767515 RepID=A0ABD5ZTB8_9EURY